MRASTVERHQVLTGSHTLYCGDMNCLSRSKQFGRGYKGKFRLTAENWGNVPALEMYKVFTPLILAEPPSKLRK